MEQSDREFIGFFLADGCALIIKYHSKGRILVRPQLTIIQRADNLPLLEWIKERYGGSIYKRNVVKHNMAGSKPAFVWTVTNFEICKKLTSLILKTNLPTRSMDAIKSVNEFCKWRLSLGRQNKYNPTSYPQIDEWIARVKKAHKFKW